MTHSPFPWSIHSSSRTAVFDADGRKIAATTQGHTYFSIPLDMAEGNAALIAAIPGMVKALEGLDVLLDFSDEAVESVWTFEDTTSIQNAFKMAHAALAAYRSKS